MIIDEIKECHVGREATTHSLWFQILAVDDGTAWCRYLDDLRRFEVETVGRFILRDLPEESKKPSEVVGEKTRGIPPEFNYVSFVNKRIDALLQYLDEEWEKKK